jgi:hypothetical protein
MPYRFALSAIALALTGMAASAADLPGRTTLGEIFAEPSVDRGATYGSDENSFTINRPEANSPQLPGYYGKAGDFYYTPYYGTPSKVIFGRLPYRCGFFGLC